MFWLLLPLVVAINSLHNVVLILVVGKLGRAPFSHFVCLEAIYSYTNCFGSLDLKVL